MSDTQIERRSCRFCGVEIPQRRLEAMPYTRICVKCSESRGSEDEIEVTTNSTGKAGSLKKTGEDVAITIKRKPPAS